MPPAAVHENACDVLACGCRAYTDDLSTGGHRDSIAESAAKCPEIDHATRPPSTETAGLSRSVCCRAHTDDLSPCVNGASTTEVASERTEIDHPGGLGPRERVGESIYQQARADDLSAGVNGARTTAVAAKHTEINRAYLRRDLTSGMPPESWSQD